MGRSKPKPAKANTPTEGKISGKLPVIKGKLNRDELDALTEDTAPIGVVKDFRDGKLDK